MKNSYLVPTLDVAYTRPQRLSRWYSAPLLFLTLLQTSVAHSSAVFINEIHYDNLGADTFEGVEVLGPQNTDLKNWQLDFYNGKDGGIYKTIELEGIIQDQLDGYGTLYFDISGIQNGPADGLALSNNGSIVEFFSYEGTLTATEGVAMGLTSMAIPVSQALPLDPVFSIQRFGDISAYSVLDWNIESESFGDINAAQWVPITAVPLPGALVFFFSAVFPSWLLKQKSKI